MTRIEFGSGDLYVPRPVAVGEASNSKSAIASLTVGQRQAPP